ncbi:phage head-tail joining protein [Parasphingorhabdus sp.]|uniref:phage head-tail joining protein n=1 Tax=Parasphingorhabdus sp. TaxID=2709688 RepID=UPI003FA72740
MATLADLQKWREELFKARLEGVRSFRDQNGEQVDYSSDREMAAALAAVDREIDSLIVGPPPKSIIFRTSKGL